MQEVMSVSLLWLSLLWFSLMQMKRTHNILSDEAVSFVRRAPGHLHCPVLSVITWQLQVPGRVGHCRTHRQTHLHQPKWIDGMKEKTYMSIKWKTSWVGFSSISDKSEHIFKWFEMLTLHLSFSFSFSKLLYSPSPHSLLSHFQDEPLKCSK